MKYSRAIFVCSILLINTLMPVAAETVMIYSDKSLGFGDEQNAIRYIEDGIMEVFFDAGHIIFNGTYQMISRAEEEENLFNDSPVYRIAKSGGASYVLNIRLRFTEDEEDLLPVSASYTFIDLTTERNLASGLVPIEKGKDWKEKEPHELVQSLGRRLGIEALKGL
ncbi:MAG: hypothetical protein ACP5IA_04360 [Sediminispirochaetaceae bacterium]